LSGLRETWLLSYAEQVLARRGNGRGVL